MKFTNNEVSEELVRQLTANRESLHLSTRSISEQLEILTPILATDDTELGDFVSQILPLFKTSNANIRHDVSVGLKKAKEESKTTQTDPNQTPPQPTNMDSSEELLNRLAALENQLKESAKEAKISQIKQTFLNKAKEKGVKNEEWLKSFVDEISISEDFDMDSRVESCLKLYNKGLSKIDPSVTPLHPSQSDADDKLLKSVLDQVADMMKQE